jgi:trans-aconitate methyltransferase
VDLDRRHAQVFGLDAERYDRARPSYPADLVGELMASNPAAVLDVGCGTGKAGRLFVERGCAVLGVEPDERMAVVARRHGLDVEVATFETWKPAGRRFDLVLSAQAWHWVDQSRGPAKAHTVLRPAGRLAVLANVGAHDADTKAAFDAIYEHLAPEVSYAGSMALGTPDERTGALFMAAIESAGVFDPPEYRAHLWDYRYTTEEWLDLLPTHSNHGLLAPERLRALLVAVADAIELAGGTIDVRYTTHLITARAR